MYSIEEFDKQKTKVLKYIIFKKRTEKEVRQKFSSVLDENLLDDIIEYLKENSYIDDNNYIERAVNEFIALNNLSIKEIKYKLYSKGVNNDIIDTYVSNNQELLEEYELSSAKKIILKKQNKLSEDELIQYLSKKGYKLEIINNAMGER